MSLDNSDKKWVKETIEHSIQNSIKKLMTWMSQNFYSKNETDNLLDKKLDPIKSNLNEVKDRVLNIEYRLDEAELPFIVKAIDQNKVEVKKIKNHIGLDK